MKINALTVCVNYADLLALSIDRWRPHFDSLTIVTSLEDEATAAMAREHGCALHQTDAFTRDGATFNKGRAIEEARQRMPWQDWILFFDADIVPEREWFAKVSDGCCSPGTLYSARRFECMDATKIDDLTLPPINTDGVGVGYFQLFHTTDPHVADSPLLETCWKHAGVYDSHFMHRWNDRDRQLLPIRLVHVGERDNWWGRGNKQAFADMQAARREHGGKLDHERIDT